MQFIYKINNIKTGKFYVGRTDNLKRRKNDHLSLLRAGKHHCIHLQRAWDKHGEESFEFEVKKTINRKNPQKELELAKIEEQKILDLLMTKNELYNCSYSSKTGSLRGKDHPFSGKHPREWMGEEAFKKTMEKLKVKKGKENPFYGKKHNKKTIEILQKKCALFGEENGMYGKNHTEEYKKMKSKCMKGRYDGEKNPFFGKQHSEKTKKLISKKLKGKQKGVKKTDEHKRKIGKSQPNSIIVEIDEIEYQSYSEAERTLGISRKTIANRAKSKKYPNYKIINK